MRTPIKVSAVLMSCALTLVSTHVFASGDIGLRLTNYTGENSTTLSRQDPVLVILSLENSAAIQVRDRNLENHRLLSEFKLTEEYRSFSEQERAALTSDYYIATPPTIALGSSTIAIDDLVSLQARNAKGDTIDLELRPMASNSTRSESVELPMNQTLLYRFGVAAGQLNKLPSGRYFLAAAIDTRARSDMWQGVAYSNTLQLNLIDPHPDKHGSGSDRQRELQSAFLLSDHQFAAAEAHARGWLAAYPDSVDAWRHLGEALAGQKKTGDALAALNTALEKFHLKYGGKPVEMPDAILDLIRRLEQGA